jgi:hypothetical protein
MAGFGSEPIACGSRSSAQDFADTMKVLSDAGTTKRGQKANRWIAVISSKQPAR